MICMWLVCEREKKRVSWPAWKTMPYLSSRSKMHIIIEDSCAYVEVVWQGVRGCINDICPWLKLWDKIWRKIWHVSLITMVMMLLLLLILLMINSLILGIWIVCKWNKVASFNKPEKICSALNSCCITLGIFFVICHRDSLSITSCTLQKHLHQFGHEWVLHFCINLSYYHYCLPCHEYRLNLVLRV